MSGSLLGTLSVGAELSLAALKCLGTGCRPLERLCAFTTSQSLRRLAERIGGAGEKRRRLRSGSRSFAFVLALNGSTARFLPGCWRSRQPRRGGIGPPGRWVCEDLPQKDGDPMALAPTLGRTHALYTRLPAEIVLPELERVAVFGEVALDLLGDAFGYVGLDL